MIFLFDGLRADISTSDQAIALSFGGSDTSQVTPHRRLSGDCALVGQRWAEAAAAATEEIKLDHCSNTDSLQAWLKHRGSGDGTCCPKIASCLPSANLQFAFRLLLSNLFRTNSSSYATTVLCMPNNKFEKEYQIKCLLSQHGQHQQTP